MNKIQLLAISLVILIAGASCERELDEAPVLTYDGEANMTIAELCDLHSVGSVDSYTEIPAGTVISGTVTSSDKDGNCYKYITIQDETGGIMIKIDDSSLDPKYSIGQRVYVECGDMVIGDYRKNKQLGFWVDGAMAGIASSQEDLYIFRDGVCGEEPEAVVVTSRGEIDGSLCNRLVKLQNVHFEDGGQAPYCDPGANTSRNIKFEGESDNNSNLVLRTSSYATFANEILPEGNGDIYGILTIYNNTYQLIIRSLADVRMGAGTGGGSTENEPIQVPLSQGWTTQGDAGWQYSAVRQSIAIQNSGANMIDSWYISPAINTSEFENAVLTLVENRVGDAQFDIYYTTNFTGNNFNSNDWTIYTPGNVLPSHNNLRIAFRFRGNNGAFWEISNIKIQ
ncbi:MAG: DUF5689 domain-containing protein [Bacteroidales bacterium]|nr:DUF5689 domain-containing protein [Bacteroidales bacterium]